MTDLSMIVFFISKIRLQIDCINSHEEQLQALLLKEGISTAETLDITTWLNR